VLSKYYKVIAINQKVQKIFARRS